eukprot:gene10282-1858_t
MAAHTLADFVSTPSALRHADCIRVALRASVGVLVVGPSGSGKTTLAQHAAASVKLTTVTPLSP